MAHTAREAPRGPTHSFEPRWLRSWGECGVVLLCIFLRFGRTGLLCRTAEKDTKTCSSCVVLAWIIMLRQD